MRNKVNKEVCEKCKREFQWSNEGDVWPGGKDNESIDCPYCGNTSGSIMTSGYISVWKNENDDLRG